MRSVMAPYHLAAVVEWPEDRPRPADLAAREQCAPAHAMEGARAAVPLICGTAAVNPSPACGDRPGLRPRGIRTLKHAADAAWLQRRPERRCTVTVAHRRRPEVSARLKATRCFGCRTTGSAPTGHPFHAARERPPNSAARGMIRPARCRLRSQPAPPSHAPPRPQTRSKYRASRSGRAPRAGDQPRAAAQPAARYGVTCGGVGHQTASRRALRPPLPAARCGGQRVPRGGETRPGRGACRTATPAGVAAVGSWPARRRGPA